MNTDQKILRLEQLWKNNSMNVVVYQSGYHAYRSFNGSKTTMHRLQSITKCKTTPYCGVFIDSRMFGNLKNYSQLTLTKDGIYARTVLKLPRDKGRGEIA